MTDPLTSRPYLQRGPKYPSFWCWLTHRRYWRTGYCGVCDGAFSR